MLKTFVLTLLLSHSIIGLSQYSIKGVIKDYSSSRKMKWANVTIDTTYSTYNKDHLFLKGTTTNENGEFKIDNISVSKVKLNLFFLGFEKLKIDNITLEMNETIDIGDIEIMYSQICAGFKCKDGIIKNRHKKIGKEIKIRYPKKGKKIKVKVKKSYILINYKDIVNDLK